MLLISPDRRAPGRSPHASACLLTGLCLYATTVVGQTPPDLRFNPGFLRQVGDQRTGDSTVLLESLASDQTLVPGRYRVSLLMNLDHLGQHELDFVAGADGQLHPCLPGPLLNDLGVKLDALADPELPNATCVDLPAVIPGALISFESHELRLSISVPQIAMRREVAGSVDPARWDSGINAAFVNYQASAQHNRAREGRRTTSSDVYLNGGINLGEWRLRSSNTWRNDGHDQNQWTRGQTYAQRDLPGTRANLTLGETFLDSDVFRGIPVSGVRVASDMSMLPDVLRSYAPVIRGVAQTRAKVEIWQNGYPVYSTYVSPGPYVIDDLSTSGSGELEIVVTEDDGQVKRFTQPYSSISDLLREGVWRYSATLGRYNPSSDVDKPWLAQGTLAIGMAWNSTVYGGIMAGDYYQASSLGVGRDFAEWGALAFDVTHARSNVGPTAGGEVQGQSYALKYGKAFFTGTSLRFAGYRYSTIGYRDFDEVVNQRSHSRAFTGSRRSRLEGSAFQQFGQHHSLNLTWSQQDYWQRSGKQRQYQLGLSTYQAGISWTLAASRSLSDRGHSSRQASLTMSMPLDLGASTHASYSLFNNRNGYNHRASLSGSSDDYRNSYTASIAQDEQRRNAAAVSLNHSGTHASVGLGVTEASEYRNLSVNASGALLLHDDGLLAGPYLGDTAALVEVPGVAGVGVHNGHGARTNAKGYAMVAGLQPYRVNQLTLDTDHLGPDVELENGTAQVVPRRGAVVKQRFAARQINRLVLTLKHLDGQPIPFGAQVVDAQGGRLGLVGQAGQVMLDLAEPQVVTVRWGEREEQRCGLDLDPQNIEPTDGYRLQTLTCA
ncbi:fimbria/pilus outer membrane usher protein [Pseudomonas sp. NBRC 111130]|uniref:fimbria/pilus outer membrane usher protein n=1 Tax=Pseudomonas sp. NBRC 111130 TaxID=1661045 RepID=UPI0009EB28F7|nr:fimbria/pilus outer membrane usher protein [Pseudomonas sp. NBRC 111130]